MQQMKGILSRLSIVALVVGLVAGSAPFAYASSFTSAKDTMTRLKISTTADHTVVFTLPTGINFDLTGNTDQLQFDFPESSAFTSGGTWATADFTFNDGTARTILSITAGAGTQTPDCTGTSGNNDVAVTLNTTTLAFGVTPCGTYTASANAATVTFTIDGTTTDGTLTNPSSANSYSIGLAQCDETASCTSSFTTSHSSTIGVSIVDDDQVSVSATVDPSLSFDIDTATTDTNSNAPYSVAFGTITATDTRVSGTTDSVNYVWFDLSTNASAGATVTVANLNGTSGLVSGSDTIDSSTATMADGTEQYGLCVVTASLSGFTRAGSYNSGTCAADSETNDIKALSTTAASIVSVGAPVSAARAQVLAGAAISGTTAAHSDYSDTLTFIATATY